MLILSIIILLLSKSNTLIKEDSIIYSRTAIAILLYSGFIVYNNLYYSFLVSFFTIYPVCYKEANRCCLEVLIIDKNYQA